MTFLILSFLTSLVSTLLVVRSAAAHAHHSADHDLSGPQKFHSTSVPRICGVGVFVPMVACVALAQRAAQLVAMSPDARAAMGASGRACRQREFDRNMLIGSLETWIGELAPAPAS